MRQISYLQLSYLHVIQFEEHCICLMKQVVHAGRQIVLACDMQQPSNATKTKIPCFLTFQSINHVPKQINRIVLYTVAYGYA